MMILRFIYGPQVEVVPSRSFAQLQVHQDILGQCQIIPEIRVEMVPGGQCAKCWSWKNFRAVQGSIQL